MSILIKGMEMPNECAECLLAKYDEHEEDIYCPITTTKNLIFNLKRPSDCPLEEVPPSQPKKINFVDDNHVWIDGKQFISLRRFLEATKETRPNELPTLQTVTADTDTISRQEVISTISVLRTRCDTDDIDDYHDLLVEAIEVLPPSPRRLKGHWIKENICEYDEAFTRQEMIEETNQCSICELNCPNAKGNKLI